MMGIMSTTVNTLITNTISGNFYSKQMQTSDAIMIVEHGRLFQRWTFEQALEYIGKNLFMDILEVDNITQTCVIMKHGKSGEYVFVIKDTSLFKNSRIVSKDFRVIFNYAAKINKKLDGYIEGL